MVVREEENPKAQYLLLRKKKPQENKLGVNKNEQVSRPEKKDNVNSKYLV